MIVKYKDLIFKLPDEDKLFHNNLYKWENEVQKVCQLANIPSDTSLVEIGGCFGMTSIFALKLFKFNYAYVFEPDNYNFDLLLLNIKKNKLQNKIEAYRYAVGNKTKSSYLFNIGKGNIGGHIISDSKGTHLCRMTDLDWFKFNNVGLVWADCQGSEGLVFAGAKKLLKKPIPWYIELAPYLLPLVGSSDEDYINPIKEYFSYFIDLKLPFKRYKIKQIEHVFYKYKNSWNESKKKPNHTNLLLLK